MAVLTEISEFVENILRLDLDTPIRGYDGNEIGESNEQAQALANRTQWLKNNFETLNEKLKEISEATFVVSINEKTGKVTLTYEDVGAAAKEHIHLPSDVQTNVDAQFVSSEEKDSWNNKQPLLISGATLKTILGISLLGDGDITFTTKDIRADENHQYTTQLEKDKWDNKQSPLISGENINTLHGKSLLGNGDILLTYKDVGADELGTGKIVVEEHVSETDPHLQYLTIDRGKKIFINKNLGNKPSGFLQLDDRGKIPSDIADLYKAEYVIVATGEDRLKIEKSSGIVICLQLDKNTTYYLNAEEDPSIEDNWKKGQETTIGNVLSTFGRSGNIIAEPGDYNANQITETEDRTFVSSEDREKWDKTQGELISGVTIKTVLGRSLLGAGDITFKSKDIETDNNNLFVTALEKKTWNNKQDNLVSGSNIATLHGKSLLTGSNINLDYNDVGADKEGTASNIIDHHLSASDPHEQYLTQTRANKYYLNKDIGNKPNGFLQLDSQGNVPAIIADLFTARYLIVNDQEERLAIEKGGDITICLQLDKNITYYLSAGSDPSIDSDWKEGQKTEVNQITSVFGRVGGIVAKEGDYNANQITETEDRTFVSSEDRENWNNKQELLISGKNISTVCGKSLLDGNDIKISDDPDFIKNIVDVIHPGDGIKTIYDDENKSISISTNMGKFTIKEEDEAIANKAYFYELKSGNENFENRVIIYKGGDVFPSKAVYLDYDNLEIPVEMTDLPEIDSQGRFPNGEKSKIALTEVSNEVEHYSSSELTQNYFPEGTEGIGFICSTESISIIPVFTTETGNDNYVAISSPTYSGLPAWKVYQEELSGSDISKVPNRDYWSDNQIWRNRTADVYIGITNSTAFPIISYGIQEFGSLYWGSNSAVPTAWSFQARNESSEEWITIETREDQTIVNGNGDWLIYTLPERICYKQYRILITDVNQDTGGRASLARIRFYDNAGFLLKNKDNKYISINKDGSIDLLNIEVTPEYSQHQVMGESPILRTALLENHYPIKVVALNNAEINLIPYKSESRMGIQTIPRGYEFRKQFINIDFTEYYDLFNKNEIRVAVTVNGTDYYIFKNDDWVKIDNLTLNTDSAINLLNNGMTWDTFNTITDGDWELRLDDDNGDKIKIAFARKIFTKEEPITPKTTMMQYTPMTGWEILSLNEVKVVLLSDWIVFIPKENGKYRFCYTFM